MIMAVLFHHLPFYGGGEFFVENRFCHPGGHTAKGADRDDATGRIKDFMESRPHGKDRFAGKVGGNKFFPGGNERLNRSLFFVKE